MALVPTLEGAAIQQQMTAQNAAQAPASVPTAPAAAAGQTALDNNMDAANAALQLRPSQPAPSTFAAKLSAALDKTPLELNPNGKPAPGAWARSLVGAATNALGDVSNDKLAPGESGIVAGVTKTLANRNARIAAQKEQQAKQQKEQDEEGRENDRLNIEKQKAQYDMAHANTQMEHEQQIWHNTQDIDPSVQQGQKAFSITQNSPHPAPIVAEDLTDQQVKQGVIDGKWNTHDFTAFPTGSTTGPNGWKQATYTVVGTGGPVQLGDDEQTMIDYLNKNHAAAQPIQPGQSMTMGQFNSLYQKASNNAAATAARNKTLVDQGIADHDEAMRLESLNVPPEWNNALAHANNDPMAALAALQANPAIMKKYPNLVNDVRTWYDGGMGKGGFDKLVAERQKKIEGNSDQITTLLNDPKALDDEGKANAAYELAKTKMNDPTLPPDQRLAWAKVAKQADGVRGLNAADKKKLDVLSGLAVPGDPNLRGPEYLNSLTPANRNTVQAIGEGRMPIANMAYLLSRNPTIVEMVTQAYPEFDANKVKGYGDLVKDFTTGPSSTKIQALNTVLPHMADLYSNLQKAGGYFGAAGPLGGVQAYAGSDVAARVQITRKQATDELAAAYNKGAITNEEHEAFAKQLETTSPIELKNNVQQITRLLQNQVDSTKVKWDEGAPSSAFRPPRSFVSAAAQNALNSILGNEANQYYSGAVQNPPSAPSTPPAQIKAQNDALLAKIPATAKQKVTVNGVITGYVGADNVYVPLGGK